MNVLQIDEENEGGFMKGVVGAIKLSNVFLVGSLVVCMSILNVPVRNAMAVEADSVQKASQETEVSPPTSAAKTNTDSQDDESSGKSEPQKQPAETDANTASAPVPETTTANSEGHGMLYAGIGVAAAVAIAAAAAGGGGSDSGSDPEPTPPTPTVKPVGADIGGKSWTGSLRIIGGVKENVTATVYQNGDKVEITTSSTQKYGQKFVGKIDRAGDMLMYEQKTGQDWSTHNDAARWNRIDLYDFVHGYHEMDRLYLTRATKS